MFVIYKLFHFISAPPGESLNLAMIYSSSDEEEDNDVSLLPQADSGVWSDDDDDDILSRTLDMVEEERRATSVTE